MGLFNQHYLNNSTLCDTDQSKLRSLQYLPLRKIWALQKKVINQFHSCQNKQNQLKVKDIEFQQTVILKL